MLDKEIILEPNKTYSFPKVIDYESIDNKYLVISRLTANWLLFDKKVQLDIFLYLLKQHTIAQCFEKFGKNNQKDILKVLTEITAKHFEDKSVNYPQRCGMYIYLTNNCNQRCNHCYMFAGNKFENELSTSEIKSLLDDFSKYGGLAVTFTGGEASTRQDFVEIIIYAKKLGLSTGVLTNGILCDVDFVHSIKPYIDEVQISIDGYDAETYKFVRNCDGFDKALAAVDNFVAAGIRTTVAITPLAETLLANTNGYLIFAKELMQRYNDSQFFIRFNTELIYGRNVQPTDEENDAYRLAIKKIQDEFSPLSKIQGFALDHINNTVFDNCGYGGLTVAANGDVYFCNLINNCKVQGNIRNDSFREILVMSDKARKQADISNLYPCNKCSLQYICGGGCRIKEFPDVVDIDFASTNKIKKVKRLHSCTQEQKKRILQMMISSNKYMYR